MNYRVESAEGSSSMFIPKLMTPLYLNKVVHQ